MGFTTSLLSVGPKIYKDRDRLVARSSIIGLCLNLGLRYCKVIVDPHQKVISIRRRLAWLIPKKRTVPFKWIKSVTYGYADENPDQYTALWGGWQTFDFFRVGLRLYPRNERSEDEDLHLFSFFGEGTIAHHGYLPDWLFWPAHAINIGGTQESTSKLFVEALSRLIGVKVDSAGC